MWDKRESNALAAVFCNATDRRMAPVGFRTSTACCPVKRAPDFRKPDTPKSTLLSHHTYNLCAGASGLEPQYP